MTDKPYTIWLGEVGTASGPTAAAATFDEALAHFWTIICARQEARVLLVNRAGTTIGEAERVGGDGNAPATHTHVHLHWRESEERPVGGW